MLTFDFIVDQFQWAWAFGSDNPALHPTQPSFSYLIKRECDILSLYVWSGAMVALLCFSSLLMETLYTDTFFASPDTKQAKNM